MGDSVLQELVLLVCDKRTLRWLRKASCATECAAGGMKVLSVYSAGVSAKQWPSYWTATPILAEFNLSAASARPTTKLPTLAILNYAALHLLHMHPVRPWYDANEDHSPAVRPPSAAAYAAAVTAGDDCGDGGGNGGGGSKLQSLCALTL